MTKVMQGVRVLEAAEYAMAPSAAAVLADWGADVIKIEHAKRGDASRGISAWGVKPGDGGFTYLWEPFNRGKRDIGIDLALPEGRQLLLDLSRTADVFITSFLPPARKKLGIDVDDLRAVNPKLIYARGSANGPKGAEADEGGFDGLTYWLRSGAGTASMPDGSDTLITLPAPAFGDIQTGMTLAGGISAALFHRERTGHAPVVDVSLMSTGIWAMQTYLVGANLLGQPTLPHATHTSAQNPVVNQYRTRDGRFIALGLLQADRYWAGFCRAIGREDLIDDERFANIDARERNRAACIAELDAVFAARPLTEWQEILSCQEGQWTTVQRVTDLNHDAQAWANGYLQKVDYGDGRTLTLTPAPPQFDETPPKLGPAPEHGQHTEEVLLEMGLTWEQIIELKDKGAIN